MGKKTKDNAIKSHDCKHCGCKVNKKGICTCCGNPEDKCPCDPGMCQKKGHGGG